MNLHNDKQSFTAAIQAASDTLGILPVFIEKDYWITLVLKRLSESKFNESVVFKGGTSLAKGHKLINRFSEDIDIAVIDVPDMSGNKVKNLIRDVGKYISVDLEESADSPLASKGSRYRKSVFTYPKTGDSRFYQDVSDKLIIEINSFANPFPYEMREIDSLIGTSLALNNQNELIRKYELMPFAINILHKNQTLLEKLVSLFRSSFEKDPAAGLSGKIRHFYDLFYLMDDKDCRAFIDSEDFCTQFHNVWSHDQVAFNEPEGWQDQSVSEAPLFLKFPELWDAIRGTYNKELSALAFAEIPEERKVADAVMYIINKLYSNTFV
ncbi:MAG: nucleotidyl transferase AbiEii/AbiGii toxin family protein [Bacteroidales bacterium]|nr:nucleotidyl transferase AbiEii/AbiGii toxin family protein [Bacteroidales bacterium]